MCTQERLRAAVDQAAGEIVWYYLAEMRGLTEVPDRSLFSLIPTNVLDRSALKRIAEAYANRLKEKELESLTTSFIGLFRGEALAGREREDFMERVTTMIGALVADGRDA